MGEHRSRRVGGHLMAENFKHRYEVTKKMLVKYQDEIVPELRRLLSEREAVVYCGNCKHRSEEPYQGRNYLCNRKMIGLVRPIDFCSFGERRESDADNRC